MVMAAIREQQAGGSRPIPGHKAFAAAPGNNEQGLTVGCKMEG